MQNAFGICCDLRLGHDRQRVAFLRAKTVIGLGAFAVPPTLSNGKLQQQRNSHRGSEYIAQETHSLVIHPQPCADLTGKTVTASWHRMCCPQSILP